jgi:hypothetical protein
VSLEYCPLSFHNTPHDAQIYFNAAVDTLFIPAWYIDHDIRDFTETTESEVKDAIQRIVIEKQCLEEAMGGESYQ